MLGYKQSSRTRINFFLSSCAWSFSLVRQTRRTTIARMNTICKTVATTKTTMAVILIHISFIDSKNVRIVLKNELVLIGAILKINFWILQGRWNKFQEMTEGIQACVGVVKRKITLSYFNIFLLNICPIQQIIHHAHFQAKNTHEKICICNWARINEAAVMIRISCESLKDYPASIGSENKCAPLLV